MTGMKDPPSVNKGDVTTGVLDDLGYSVLFMKTTSHSLWRSVESQVRRPISRRR